MNKRLIATIERPNGTTYKQEIEIIDNSKTKSIEHAQTLLGDPWTWKTINGRRTRVIRKDAYLIVDAYFVTSL